MTKSDVNDRTVELASQILLDRFEVIDEPLGWRCRACRTTVSARGSDRAEIARLAETAADHGLFCGRCDD